MPLNARLTVIEEVDGGWRLTLSRPDATPAAGQLGLDVVARLVAQSEALPSEARGVLTARAHAAWTASETALGRALTSALCELSEVWGGIGEVINQALALGDEVLLAVETQGRTAGDMPWELLHVSPEGQLMSGVRPVTVARVAPPGRAAGQGSGQRLRLVMWTPDPDEDVVSRVLGTREDLAEELGISVVVASAPDHFVPAAEPGEVDVLHVLCQDQETVDQLGRIVREVTLQDEDPARSLALAARRSALVVLEICEGAAVTLDPTVSLASGLVAAGAVAVVGPVRPVGTGALDTFVRPLISCLHRGESLARAVRVGQAAVSALGLAHPANRWWILQLVLASEAAAGPRVRTSVWPDDLPLPSVGVLSLLEAATAVARGSMHGFVGVEHLALALDESLANTPLSARALALLEPQRAEIRAQLAALTLAGELPDRLTLTPRLLRLGATLPVGFDLDALWRALASERFCPLLGLDRLEPTSDGADMAPTLISEAPDRVAVIGGPEDGRVLPFLLGSSIGRWHMSVDAPMMGLYQGTPLTDTRLSRDAVRWLAPGRLLLKRPATRRRAGRSTPLPAGEVMVADGDVLVLSAATRVGFCNSAD